MIWRWTLNKTSFGPIAEFIGEGLSVLSLKRFGCSSLNYRLCVCHWGFIYWVVKNFTQMKTLKQCPELGWVRAWNHLGWCGIKFLVHCKVTEEGTFPSWGTNSATSTVAWLRCGCCGVCGHRQCSQSQLSPGAAQQCLCQYSCTHWGQPGLLWPLLTTSTHVL